MFTSPLKPTKCWIVMGYIADNPTEKRGSLIQPLKVFRFKHEAERYCKIEDNFDTCWIEESRYYE